jgi:hypothetical protein
MEDSRNLGDILEGIQYELMIMNAMTALKLVPNPTLSSEERRFVEGIVSSVIDADEEEDEDETPEA